MSRAGVTARVIGGVLLIVGLVLLVRSTPDLARYVKIRRM
jgi:hypothetical protein